jgi:hypothetical protein
VKRKALLIGVPLIVLAAWAASSVGGTHGDAEVDISAQHPIQLRGAVVATITAAGGVRVSEDTSYDDGGSSTLTFNLPTAKIEEATRALTTVGGHITDQKIDLSDAASAASGVSQKLTSAQSCVNSLGAAVSSESARTQLAQCRSDLAAAAGQLSNSKVNLTTSVLIVKISPISGFNPALLVCIFLLIIAAAGIGLLMWRTERFHPMVDVREMADFESVDDDLHLRRN